jgi:hypothetical protein
LAQAQTFLDQAKQVNLLSIYEQRLNRAVAKKLAELAELQRVRKVARAASPPRNRLAFSTSISRPALTPEISPKIQKKADRLPDSGQARLIRGPPILENSTYLLPWRARNPGAPRQIYLGASLP